MRTGGYLKIAPEAIGEGPLSKMMKPGVGTYYRFKQLFDPLAGGGQRAVPDPLLHRGASGHDGSGHARAGVSLKQNGYRADQVQAFLPGPMATATRDLSLGKPLRRVTAAEEVARAEGPQGAAAAQGVLALSRPEQLADAASRVEADGAAGLDRQRQAPARAAVPAARHRQIARG